MSTLDGIEEGGEALASAEDRGGDRDHRAALRVVVDAALQAIELPDAGERLGRVEPVSGTLGEDVAFGEVARLELVLLAHVEGRGVARAAGGRDGEKERAQPAHGRLYARRVSMWVSGNDSPIAYKRGDYSVAPVR